MGQGYGGYSGYGGCEKSAGRNVNFLGVIALFFFGAALLMGKSMQRLLGVKSKVTGMGKIMQLLAVKNRYSVTVSFLGGKSKNRKSMQRLLGVKSKVMGTGKSMQRLLGGKSKVTGMGKNMQLRVWGKICNVSWE